MKLADLIPGVVYRSGDGDYRLLVDARGFSVWYVALPHNLRYTLKLSLGTSAAFLEWVDRPALFWLLPQSRRADVLDILGTLSRSCEAFTMDIEEMSRVLEIPIDKRMEGGGPRGPTLSPTARAARRRARAG